MRRFAHLNETEVSSVRLRTICSEILSPPGRVNTQVLLDVAVWVAGAGAWTLEQKHRLLRSVIEGYPIGALTVQRDKSGELCVLDGIERVHTLAGAFLRGWARSVETTYHLDLDNMTTGYGTHWAGKHIPLWCMFDTRRLASTLRTLDRETADRVEELSNELSDYPIHLIEVHPDLDSAEVRALLNTP